MAFFAFFVVLLSVCVSLPRTIYLVITLHIAGMTGKGYKRFSPARMICGIMSRPLWVYQIMKRAHECSGYMSTPIAPNTAMGTSLEENLGRAKTQECLFLSQGTQVLNPGSYPVAVPPPHWWSLGPTEMLCIWTLVIVIMSKQGKVFYYKDTYAEVSGGCEKELRVAKTLGMQTEQYI